MKATVGFAVKDCLRSTGWGKQDQAALPLLLLQGFGDVSHFLPCNAYELWENCSREGTANHQDWVWPSAFETENAHIKQELLQGKSYATSFALLHLPCIHAGKMHTQKQQLHWILLIHHSCCFLPSPSPSSICCTEVLHQTDPEKWLISSTLPLHSQPCHSCLSQSPLLSIGYYLIIASLACQFSLQPSNLPRCFSFFIF